MSDKKTPEEVKLNKTFEQAVSMIEKLEKVFERSGAFAKGIQSVGGKLDYLNTVRSALAKANSDIKDAHYDALNHIGNPDFKIRKPLPKVEKVVEQIVQKAKEKKPEPKPPEEPKPVYNVEPNQQSYSQLRAEAKEL